MVVVVELFIFTINIIIIIVYHDSIYTQKALYLIQINNKNKKKCLRWALNLKNNNESLCKLYNNVLNQTRIYTQE